MALVTFIYYKILQSIKSLIKNKKAVVSNLIVLLLIVILGIAFVKTFNSAIKSNEITGIALKGVVYTFIIVTSFSKSFIPYYKPIINIIPEYYPVKRYNRTLLNIINEFLSPYYIYIILFIVVITASSTIFQISDYIFCVLLLINVRLVIRIIQFFLEFKVRFIYLYFAFFAGIIVFIFYFMNIISEFKLYFSSIILALLSLLNILIESEERKTYGYKKITDYSRFSIFSSFVLLLNNSAFRASLLLYLFIKTIFLSTDIISIYIDHIVRDGRFMWIFISPLLLFSFVYNNFWGFFRNIWFSIFIRSNRFKDYLIFYVKILALPLIIDFTISIIYIVLVDKALLSSIIIYLCLTSFCVCLGFYSSLHFPKMVIKKVIFEQNTSYIITLVYVLYLLSFIFFSKMYLPILFFVNVIIGYMIILYTRYMREYEKERFYRKLYY